MINLVSKIGDSLRFCSKIFGPVPTIFNMPSDLAKSRHPQMSEKKAQTLKLWQRRKARYSYKKILCECDTTDLNFLCECDLNVFNGNVPSDFRLLVPFGGKTEI